MAADGDSFLPRLQSVFYAVFDVRQGPKIVYQVPDGLIASSSGHISGLTSFSSSPVPSTPTTDPSLSNSRASSVSIASPYRPESRMKISPQTRSLSSVRTLFNFDDISKYVIPKSRSYGRLVVCNARRSKIIGFPAQLRGNYERNYFRFNVCFVFDHSADLSCYEPIVRKVSRVLTTCEEESAFLSSSETSPKIYAVLEQLYEDLNSYSETSIPIDNFNSIELKIFPFYPNPPTVKDWMVPLALISLERVIEANWDLTMVKVCQFIDGTNHVSRIAQLAHCDLELTRQAISHLLYYQVIMTIDVFQYSNMYTLRKSVQWLADEPHVKEECGPYTVKEGKPIPDWPKLLHLYSRIKPGKTVFEWMQDDVCDLHIDVRRFTSFGVIKGFLRRIHRWPILVEEGEPQDPKDEKVSTSPSPSGRKRAVSLTTPMLPTFNTPVTPVGTRRRRTSEISPPFVSVTTDSVQGTASPPPRLSTASAAEVSLGQLQARGIQQPGHSASTQLSVGGSTRTARTLGSPNKRAEMRRHSLISPTSLYEIAQSLARPPTAPTSSAIDQPLFSDVGRANQFGPLPSRPRVSRSPTSTMIAGSQNPSTTVPTAPVPLYPPELLTLLDGEHHTDELCTRFEVGWPTLETWLVAAGGGKGDGDYGRVLIIYR
ncbi:nitrogen permease regulator 2-domain-containing protein [Amylostereum chailletii]|nr:nitrogen permease regulator 2-domain-containing protein [Amylostereum chailletii]